MLVGSGNRVSHRSKDLSLKRAVGPLLQSDGIVGRLPATVWRCIAFFLGADTEVLWLVITRAIRAQLPCQCWFRAVRHLVNYGDLRVIVNSKATHLPNGLRYLLCIMLPLHYVHLKLAVALGAIKMKCDMCKLRADVRSQCYHVRLFYRFDDGETESRVYICLDCLVRCYMETAPCTQRRRTAAASPQLEREGASAEQFDTEASAMVVCPKHFSSS